MEVRVNKIYGSVSTETVLYLDAQSEPQKVIFFGSSDSMYITAYGCGCISAIEAVYFNDSLIPTSNKYLCKPGVYKINAKLDFSSGLPFSFRIINSLEVGIPNYVQDASVVKLFPNPAHETITIQSSEIINSMTITDLNSDVIFAFESCNKVFQVPLDYLPSGIYFVQIITESKKRVFRKFVVY